MDSTLKLLVTSNNTFLFCKISKLLSSSSFDIKLILLIFSSFFSFLSLNNKLFWRENIFLLILFLLNFFICFVFKFSSISDRHKSFIIVNSSGSFDLGFTFGSFIVNFLVIFLKTLTLDSSSCFIALFFPSILLFIFDFKSFFSFSFCIFLNSSEFLNFTLFSIFSYGKSSNLSKSKSF